MANKNLINYLFRRHEEYRKKMMETTLPESEDPEEMEPLEQDIEGVENELLYHQLPTNQERIRCSSGKISC